MNKVIRKVLIALLIVFSFVCVKVEASDYEQYNGSKNIASAKKKLSDTDQKTADNACKKYMGMEIESGKYNRYSDVGGDEVKNRIVTIKVNSGTGTYRYKVYTTDYDKFESIQECYKNENSGCTIDGDEKNILDSSLDKFKDKKKATEEISIPADKEAQVIVYPNEDKKIKVKLSIGTTDITCKKNTINKNTMSNLDSDDTGEIDGNVVTEFVQNPQSSVLIKNVRRGSTACEQAEKGIYISSKGKKYDIQDIAKEYNVDVSDWKQYYEHVFGGFCSSDYVPFNLTVKQIKILTKKLIDVYEKIKPMELNSTENIEAEIEQLISEYGISSDHIYTDQEKLKDIKLDCDYLTKNNSMAFMYKEIGKTVSATVYKNYKQAEKGEGDSIDVCKVGCYEVLKVSYNKPVAIKAGLCFSYKVTISSHMKCSAQLGPNGGNGYDAIISKIPIPSGGSAVPICRNGHKSAQAGPNDEFDSCVNKCDSGKYTQKCINKCYDEVYESDNSKNNKATKTSTKSSVRKTTVEKVVNYVNNNIIDKTGMTLMANENDYEEEFGCLYSDKEDFKYPYYKGGKKVTRKCGKTQIACDTNDVRNNIDVCAKFYTIAKALYPYGTYERTSGNKVTWNTAKVIDDIDYQETEDIKMIPYQIALASPFYLRDVEATKKLLLDLTAPSGRKYSISSGEGDSHTDRGIKRQYRHGYHCPEYCHYEVDADALTPHEYVFPIKESLNNISAKLDECKAKAECESNQTTDYNISVDYKQKGEKTTVDYKIGSTVAKTTDPNGNKNMFVIGDIAEDRDADLRKPSANNTNGILGLCFKNEVEPYKYRTTVTFPASYVNVKTGKVCWKTGEATVTPTPSTLVPCDNSDIINNGTATKGNGSAHLEKDGYFCTPYNSDSVNAGWWSYKNENSSLDGFTPEEWNIRVTSSKFGKYKWGIKFRCFYSIYNEICRDNCKNDDGTEKKKESIALTNYSFKVVDTADMISTEKNTQKVGFNWTAKAQNKYLLTESANVTEEAKTYAINPEKYVDYVNTNPEASIDDSNIMYHFVLTKNEIRNIKADSKKSSYTDFDGEYEKVKGVDDLVYYRSNYFYRDGWSGILQADSKRDNVIGKNNEYKNLDSLLS